MKHRIKTVFSVFITVSMLLSLIPFYGAAVDDEFEGFETLEEIPFEFELEPGDLPFEQLKDAVLALEDIPSCIDPALAEARGHVNRLYLQEPDDIECKKESNLTDQQVATSIQTSLNLGYAAFITTTRGRSPYVYGATGTTRHYLAIVAIQYSDDGNSDNDFVVISNCHYHDDVFGIYAVQLSDFCTSIEYLYFCTSKTNS